MRHVTSTARLSLLSLPIALSATFVAAPAAAGILYDLASLIAVPASPDNTSAGGLFTTYDISFFDANTQLYYLGDRSNAAVDIFSAATNSFVGRVGGSGGLFSGIQPPPPAPANNDISGPNGVLVVNLPNQHVLYAGNGDSTLKAFNLAVAGNPQIANVATGTPADKRVDEMAFSPTAQRLLVANNAADTPFATLVNTNNNSIVTKIVFDGTNGTPKATNGIEQPFWDKGSGIFFISIPQVNGAGPGGVAAVDPNGTVLHFYNFGDPSLGGLSACSPAGLAGNGAGQLVVGCGVASQTILLDTKANGGNGAVKTFSQVSGEDMVWFDPKTGRYFLAARLNPGGPVLGIIDGNSEQWLENIATTPGDHSVAVDPVSGEVFVPMGAVGNGLCPNGCIAVYRPVPEPGSLSLMAVSLIGLAGFIRYRRRR